MDPTNTKTAVINLGLSHIKQQTITSPTDQNERARKGNLFYDRARRAALRACDWNFARTYQALSLLGSMGDSTFDPTWATPQDVIPGFVYCYAQPSNCVAVRQILIPSSPRVMGPFFDAAGNPTDSFSFNNRNDNPDNTPKWQIGRSPKSNIMSIACDLQSAWARFTYDIVDESQFDDMFVEAFGYEMALRLAMPLSADQTLTQMVKAGRDEFVGEARRVNGDEGTVMQPRTSNYENARDY